MSHPGARATLRRAARWSLLALAPTASAAVPLDPFPDCGPEQLEACPSDLGEWEHISWVPEPSVDSVREEELEAGSGIRLDVALRHSAGRWDVPIAVLDSGIEWENTDLVNKVWLNTAELPPPQDASGIELPHDADGNGLVNIQDYLDDPRVDPTAGRDPADHMLDVSDLIYTFSDGVDDDGNGYIDDIAGWDFFHDDNDPHAELRTQYGGHGTGIMRGATAEGDDGGDLGTCPNCPVIALRTGDAFITDGDRLAQAITYATDIGARVIGHAGAGLSNPAWVRRALEHADSRGVLMVAAAGDENAYHHNLPAAEDPILYVHAVTSRESDPADVPVYSFLNFSNCNNFGPRVDLVAPSDDCASGATQHTTGAVGLLLSAALDHGVDLSADEARALLRGSSFDIHLSEAERAEANAYPSGPGWDPIHGEGRLDIGAAVEQVVAGDIPPAVRLTSPRWFAWANEPTPIHGKVSARSEPVEWRLEWSPGAWPEEQWTLLAEGSGAIDGELAELDHRATWSFDELFDEDVMQRFERAHEPMLLLRLSATDAQGHSSQTHRGIFVQQDPDLLPGFPLDLDSSMESSPALVDLDGDGDFEIVQATGEGALHVLQTTGEELPGFPVYSDPLEVRSPSLMEDSPTEGLIAGPAVGDLDGDGLPELVIGTVAGKVYAFSSSGERLPGFPVEIQGRAPEEIGPETAWDHSVLATPALGDVDGDGDLEIVVGDGEQLLHVWQGDGELMPGYPLDLCVDCSTGARIVSSPALGDIDGDGDLDCAIGTNEIPPGDAGYLFLIDLAEAAVWEGWPITRDGLINQEILPVVGAGHPSSPALADLDGDGDLEIAAPALLSTPDLLHHDASIAISPGYAADAYGADASFLDGSFLSMVTNPSLGDLDGDGLPDVALGGASVLYLLALPIHEWTEYQHALGAWSGLSGEMMPGFPRQVDDVAFLAAPAIADVSGDGQPELIYGTGGHFVYAWDASGELAQGWPHFTGGWTLSGPAVGDLDGDGRVEVVSGTREGWLFAWRTQGRADQAVQWSGMRHDPANTGNSLTPLAPQLGPPPVETAGCCGAEGHTGAAWLLFPLGLLGLRRRRDQPAADAPASRAVSCR